MTVLEFWGCALITFGPALAMFSLTVAHDPIKVILLISSSFFWLISFLAVAICWAVIHSFCDYLIIGALLAVLSQESFRYLFHIVSKKAQIYLAKIIDSEMGSDERSASKRSSRTNEIQLNNPGIVEFQEQIPLSYGKFEIDIVSYWQAFDIVSKASTTFPDYTVSGLGFGLMNGAFSLMNVLTDYLGPGTVGLKGDSSYFLLVSSLTTLAFILLNVSWSILMSESIEKSDKRLAFIVLSTHLVATTIVSRANDNL